MSAHQSMMPAMEQQTHQDHAAHAETAFEDARNVTEPMERNELLSVASYHAAMASYRLAQEISARLATGE